MWSPSPSQVFDRYRFGSFSFPTAATLATSAEYNGNKNYNTWLEKGASSEPLNRINFYYTSIRHDRCCDPVERGRGS